MNPIPVVNTILCGTFAVIYFVVLYLSSLYLLKDKFKSNIDIKEFVAKAGIYGIFMSLPFMPFVYGFSVVNEFSISVITLFFLSNIVWQTLFIRFKHGKGLDAFFVAVSSSNLIAWALMALSNHLFYYKLGKVISNLFQ